jgi:CHAT domain-containing protein
LSGFGLTRSVPGFDPLPAVREELETIVRQGILPGEIYFDDQFNAAQLRTALDKRAPVLHIASHFVFQPGTEADSFLVLGDGSRLSLAELKRYRFRDVDLITLSACETAVGGGKDANGKEIEGFGVLAQRQGAKGVLATLWPVADESTGTLTQGLYRIRQASPEVTKAEALRRAQLQLFRGKYAHPFFWAPFILMGNWL